MKGVIVLVLLLLPNLVFGADPSGLVTCTGPDCNFCTFVQMVNVIINWLFGFLVLVAVMILMYAGFKLVVSAGNPAALTAAKGMVSSVIIGFVIVLAAWLIVDTMMKALINPDAGFGVWNEIGDCSSAPSAYIPSETSDTLYCYSIQGVGADTCVYGLSNCSANRAEAIDLGYVVDSCRAN